MKYTIDWTASGTITIEADSEAEASDIFDWMAIEHVWERSSVSAFDNTLPKPVPPKKGEDA